MKNVFPNQLDECWLSGKMEQVGDLAGAREIKRKDMWSMRQNEYIADEYACKIGFGNELAYVLDNALCSNPKSGLLKALYSTHPSTDDRIARMQSTELVNYSRY